MASASFQAWSMDHLVALGAIASTMAITAIALFFRREGVDALLRKPAGWACILGLIIGIPVTLITPGKLPAEAIPFHLCSLSLLFAGLGLLTRHPFFMEWTYIFGILGVLQALLTPDLPKGFPSVNFIVFFFNHGMILVGAVWFLAGDRLTIRSGALLRFWIYGCIYMVLALLVNTLTGTNFGYLSRKPDTPTLLDVMGPWPIYLIPLQILGVLKMAFLLLPFANRWELLFGRPNFALDYPQSLRP